ncbi:MAG: EAL domain-containing protein [Sedimenticola sp.]
MSKAKKQKQGEATLKKIEKKYRNLLDSLVEGIWVINKDSHTTLVNPQMSKMLGYQEDEMVGQHLFNFMDEQGIELCKRNLERRQQGIKEQHEFEFLRKDGSRIYTLMSTAPVFDEEGNFNGAIASVKDISEQKRMEQAVRISQETMTAVLDNAPAVIYLVDEENRLQFVNRTWEQIFNTTKDAVIGKSIYNLFPKEVADQFSEKNRRVIEKGELVEEEEIVPLKDEIHTYITQKFLLPDGLYPNRVLGGISTDITHQKKQESELRLAASVIESTTEGIMVTDPKLRIVSINPAFTVVTGFTQEEVVGKKPSVLSSGKHDHDFYKQMWQEIKTTGRWSGEIWNRRKNGEVYPEWLNIMAIRNEQNKITNYAGIFSDLEGQEQFRERLHDLAYFDALTGLPNRTLFNDRLSTLLAQASREETQFAVLFLDLNRFKYINDTFGHTAGDQLLKFVAKQLVNCVRDTDTVARLGGDEFVIILPNIHSADSAANIATMILEVFSTEEFILDNHEVFINFSIGISIFPDNAEDIESLLASADTAMYRAKKSGSANYSFYTEDMSAQFRERLLLETDIRRGIERNEFFLLYQPQYDIKSKQMIGCEALARWDHPQRGMVFPGEFIPVAEETGLILPLGEWILDAAISQAAKWQQEGKDLILAVNISALQLQHPHIERLLESIISSPLTEPYPIELEFTETVLMENADKVQGVLEQLGALGVKFSIDDFGTGYSSLSYLKRFAVDKLKIDRSFVRDITVDVNDSEISSTIIAMGRNLNLRVIAEGVETVEQYELLKSQGCDEVQGFLFSKPMLPEEISELIDDCYSTNT